MEVLCKASYDREKRELRIDCSRCEEAQRIEESQNCMASVITNLLRYKNVERVVLSGAREYEYDAKQVKLLLEIANVIEEIRKRKLCSLAAISLKDCDKCVPHRFASLRLILDLLARDPINAYKQVIREIRHVKTKQKRATNELCLRCYEHYLNACLLPMKNLLENCELIKIAKTVPRLKSTDIYREVFSPLVRPNFMFTRFMLTPPKDASLIERYKVGESVVEIYKLPLKTRFLYHLIPPEFKLEKNEFLVLDAARRYLAEHRPTHALRSERMLESFIAMSRDLLAEIAKRMNVKISESKLKELAKILTRYTAGLGILELLLADEKIQDISINSPIGATPIFIFHQDYEDCETNLIPSKEDAETWATRLRLQSGRPLDEANPVLDTELLVPGGRARVAAITRTLSPYGLAFALRRHRARPWTFPLFIKHRFFNPLAAGLLWFLIDNAASMLIAGSRSSGKTSLLGACMLQIMPKSRLIVVEDSVTGDSELLVKLNGKLERVKIEELFKRLARERGFIRSNGREIIYLDGELEVFSIDERGKLVQARALAVSRHKTRKRIYEIITRTGRRIKVTEDHSLFTIGEQSVMREVRASELRKGSYVAVPRSLMFDSRVNELDLLELLSNERLFVRGKSISEFVKANWKKLKYLAKKLGYSKSSLLNWKRSACLPIQVAKAMGIKASENLFLTTWRKSPRIPAKLKLDEKLMEFFGLWLADGCYDGDSSVLISASDSSCQAIAREIAKRFRINYDLHKDGITLRLHSKLLVSLMKKLGFRGNAKTKRIPSFVFGLKKELKAALLRGVFSGDGCVSDKEVVMYLQSPNLLKDLQTLLLSFGIVSRIAWKRRKDGTMRISISATKFVRRFASVINFIQDKKRRRLRALANRKSTHDTSDVIPLSIKSKLELAKLVKGFNSYDYIARQNQIGREALRRMVLENEIKVNPISLLPFTDLFWDEVKEIRVKETNDYVYDISVPGFENFICENFVVHNTLELPVAKLRELGYNVQHLKCRSIITQVETELPAEEAIRTALRLGDSCLILGEVRSTEARALYEAMRIGALANVVAGTIHGESPYGVFDRVVNDLGVPPTSFKATDIIVIANRLKSPDGLHTFRRVVELTEVRKHWQRDPLEEKGFVDLMVYSAKSDELKPTQTLLIGESEVLNRIASRVREWRGYWERVWANIKLRARIMETIAKFGEQKPELLEAESVLKSNEAFHLISEAVRNEVGYLDSEEIYKRWFAWFKQEAKG